MKDTKTNERVPQAAMLSALMFIERRGYKILDREWECPAGKIGIVARDDEEDALVFIDVRGRKDEEEGLPSSGLIEAQRGRLEGIAGYYLAAHVGEIEPNIRVRFDVVSVLLIPPDRALISHHQDALGTMPAGAVAVSWDAVAAALAEGDGNIGLHLEGKKLPEYLRELILADIEASR